MIVKSINHVALTLPKGKEDIAREFYGEVLGLEEIPKPSVLLKNGGVWFELPGGMSLHFTVQDNYDPSTSKVHLAYEVESLQLIQNKLEELGFSSTVGERIPDFERINIRDPFGNRIELMQKV